MISSVDRIFALLFVADSPASTEALGASIGLTEGQTTEAIDLLRDRLDREGPLQLVELAGGYQLATKEELSECVSAFLKPQRQRLSKSLMEVLAIVAYRQPITSSEIEAIRGVQSDYGIRILQERRLIREVGRKHAPGRPSLFGTTQQFLHQFKLKDLDGLPKLDAGLAVSLPAVPES